MNVWISLITSFVAVLILMVIGAIGGLVTPLNGIFGILVPYLAVAVFIVGIVWRVVKWGKAPVPFPIPTTCGQQKSLPWIKASPLESPTTKWGVAGRMALEILCFRSLFRNTNMSLKEGPKITYGPTQWLWVGALAFHWTFLIVLVRHLRFFTQPIPYPLQILESLDGFLQIGLPVVLISGFVLGAAATYLLVRRLFISQVRYISLPNDYFPLFLILSIVASGILMRYIFKVNVVGVKELTMGLATFHPSVVEGIGFIFYIHLFLVCALFAYFPFSKLMHLGGVFLSPTRNLRTNTREIRHVNPWNPAVKVHTYEQYEDEFREKMIEAGLPVDKQPAEQAAQEE